MISDMLMPYQREAAERIASSRSMLLADQPGLGKTFTSLGALELSGALTPGSVSLIAGPVITCDTAWLPTLKKQMPEVNAIDGFSGSRAQRDKRVRAALRDDVANIVVTNHHSVGMSAMGKAHLPVLFERELAAIVIDESHEVLPMTYNFASEATEFWRGLFALSDANLSCVRLAISGTPDRGKHHYRLGTWRFLMPVVLSPDRVKYQDWLKRHFYTYFVDMPTVKNGRRFNVKIQKIGQMLDTVKWAKIDAAMMVRRTKSEVAQQLPAKQYVDVDIPLPDDLNKAYINFVNDCEAKGDFSQQNALVMALRSMQFAVCDWAYDRAGNFFPVDKGSSAKRDWLVAWMVARGMEVSGPGSKVVISSQFTKVLNWLKKELSYEGIEADILSGDTSPVRRKEIQERFQDPDSSLRVVLLSSTLGVGIDLDAADDLIFVDIPRNPDVQEQVEDRIHRVSRVHQVTIWRLRSRGTIDVAISAKNDETFQETRSLMDGVREVDFERRILARLGV
jgi:superfamily II DNA or RNA helicase